MYSFFMSVLSFQSLTFLLALAYVKYWLLFSLVSSYYCFPWMSFFLWSKRTEKHGALGSKKEDWRWNAASTTSWGFHWISKSIPTWLFSPCRCSLSPNVTSLEELSMIPTAKSTSLLPISLPPWFSLSGPSFIFFTTFFLHSLKLSYLLRK